MPFPGNQDDDRRPGSGWFSMLLAALFFLLVGAMMVWEPGMYWSAGATGRVAGESPMMTVYSKETVPMLGWVAILTSVLLFAVSWRIRRGK